MYILVHLTLLNCQNKIFQAKKLFLFASCESIQIVTTNRQLQSNILNFIFKKEKEGEYKTMHLFPMKKKAPLRPSG